MERDKKKQAVKGLLISAMLGFATATELAPTRKFVYTPPAIELELDTPDLPIGKHFAKKTQEVIFLSTYSGQISNLLPQDLDNTGMLVKVYAPKLFVPSTEIITIHNVTRIKSLKTDYFKVYEIEPTASLKKTDGILLPSDKPAREVVNSFATFDYKATGEIIETFAKEVHNSKEISGTDAERIFRSMNEKHELLAKETFNEFQAIRRDMEQMQLSLKANERAVAETLERLKNQNSLKHIINKTPTRMVEHAVDETVLFAARQFTKLIVGSFFM